MSKNVIWPNNSHFRPTGFQKKKLILPTSFAWINGYDGNVNGKLKRKKRNAVEEEDNDTNKEEEEEEDNYNKEENVWKEEKECSAWAVWPPGHSDEV